MDDLISLLGPPSIDLEKCMRLGSDGKEVPNGNVDIILHISCLYTAATLAPSMVCAMVFMLWQREYRLDVMAVGSIDECGRVSGYPSMDHNYIMAAHDGG